MRSVKDLLSLKGRVALITGGVGHIGSAVAAGLAEQGASIVLLDFVEEKGRACCEEISRKHNVKASFLRVDLENENEVRQAPVKCVDEHGRLDIIVHCAALVGTTPLPGWGVPFEQQNVDTWRRCLEINLTSAFVLCQAAQPALVRSGHGSVILTGSIYGVVGPNMALYAGTTMGNPAAYAASKGGLMQLMRWMATNLAPEIRVNAISPGGIWRNQPEQFRARYEALTPLKRMGVEEDLMGAAVFLASDMSSYITGQNIMVDGGWTAW